MRWTFPQSWAPVTRRDGDYEHVTSSRRPATTISEMRLRHIRARARLDRRDVRHEGGRSFRNNANTWGAATCPATIDASLKFDDALNPAQIGFDFVLRER
jgi:hypothetical protein